MAQSTATAAATFSAAQFRDPPAEYRSAPFWSWNDALTDDELRRQIEAMHDAGQGGFFMHSRVGLRTPYLSDDWFARVRTCIAEAERLGMGAWLYDEDRWPSGFAGGLVPAQNKAFRSKALLCLVSDTPVAVAEALVRMTGRWANGRLTDVQPWDPADGFPPAGRVLVQCHPWTAPMGQGWFGGTTYLDTLNPEAVAAFLASTYDRYAAEVGGAFGGAVPGIFTDEPSAWYPGSLPAVHGVGHPPAVPWTSGLPAAFRARHGYDLPPHLPALFYDLDGDTVEPAAVRHDYWETVAHLLYNAWSRQLYEWCEQHGLRLTGHHMAEDSLLLQMRWTGGVMPHYRAYHLPGIDKLQRHTRQVVTVKQLDSVVEQTGKERALCEAFGCSGQDFAIEGRWWITNWLAVLGINFFNPHLALYTMRGERKRDYPPNLSYQQPWWPYQKPYEDATARLSYALSQGQRQVDVLVLHPLTSAWAAYKPEAAADVQALDRMLVRLSEGLLAMHRDFHYGDETILADLGTVEGETLRVGQQTYRVVIVPPTTTLRRPTVDLLARFAATGGRVIGIGDGPHLIDGRVASRPVLPIESHAVVDEVSDTAIAGGSEDASDAISPLPALSAALDAAMPPRVTIAGAATDRIWYQARALPDGRDLLFLANTRETEDAACTVGWAGAGGVERWDLVTGEMTPFSASHADGMSRLDVAIPRMASALFIRTPGTESASTSRGDRRTRTVALNDQWTVERLTPNTLVLDCPELRLGDDAWRAPMPILEAAQAVQQAGYGVPFTLRFAFDIDGDPPDDGALVIEEPGALAVTINGMDLPPAAGWWIDRVFQRYPLGSMLRSGRNTVEVSGRQSPEVELEAIYLTGGFDVPVTPVARAERVTLTGQRFAPWHVRPRLAPEPPSVSYAAGADLVAVGLPFFTGEVRLSQDVEIDLLQPESRAVLAFDTVSTATALVEVNDVFVGQTLWPPYDVDVTDTLRPGKNRIAVCLVTSLRNLLGPFHTPGGDPTFVGPASFRDQQRCADERWLVPLGLGRAHLSISARA